MSCLQFYTLVLESVVLFLIKEQFLDIKEAQCGRVCVHTLVLEIVVVSVLVLHGGYMIVRRPEGAGWYNLVLLRNNIEEGADSEEELWVTGSESESDTDESDTEDGQDDC